MINIFYYNNTSGTPVAKWPGQGIRENGQSKKKGQLYLGQVINKEKHIFFKRGEGYYVFDPADQSKKPIAPSDIPAYTGRIDKRERERSVCCAFGGDYFLSRLIPSIEYNGVLDRIEFQNRDALYALLHFYMLSDRADMHAEYWYKNSYASFLYPKANLASQRISDLYKAIGSADNHRRFLEGHIRYITSSTDDAYYVLVDSTGCPNACDIPITKVSKHENEVNIEFRVVVVVQQSTGLPIYYEVIPGNVVDISTLKRIINKLKLYKCKIRFVLGDAGYCCPAVMERLILSGIEFMTRMNPTYDLYKETVAVHFQEISDPGIDNTVRYRGRTVKIVKVKCVIGTDKETNEKKKGFLYLCRDIQSYHSKADHLMSAKKAKSMTTDEIMKAIDRFGVFAIVSTRDLDPDDVLPEYYTRQGIEQFFDYAKSYGKMLPVRNQNLDTVNGHMLMSFVATFLNILLKNKLNLLDTRYVAIPAVLRGEVSGEDTIECEAPDGTSQLVLMQDPIAPILTPNPGTLFFALQLQSAEIFDEEIVPSCPTREVNDFFKAFHLHYPETIMREHGAVLPVLKEGQEDKCSRAKAFAYKPSLSDQDIQKRRQEKERKQLEEMALSQGVKLPDGPKTDAGKPKRGPGRPPGSKNKKTLEREAEQKRLEDEGHLPVKRRRGRPPGSKNKKTLEREALEKELAEQAKHRGPGRPRGSKNKKTLEKEALEKAAAKQRGPGRPPGSKNKKTLEREARAKHKGPGRPRGSKNKKTGKGGDAPAMQG